jgi:hypothetical protein
MQSLTSAIRRNRFALTVCCQIRKDGPHHQKEAEYLRYSRNSVVATATNNRLKKIQKTVLFEAFFTVLAILLGVVDSLGNIFNSFLVCFRQAHEGVPYCPQHKQSFSQLSCWFHAGAVVGRDAGSGRSAWRGSRGAGAQVKRDAARCAMTWSWCRWILSRQIRRLLCAWLWLLRLWALRKHSFQSNI